MFRVVFFGGRGEFSATHLEAVARAHRVVGVFTSGERTGIAGRAGRWLRARGLRSDPVADTTRRLGVPCSPGDELPGTLCQQVAALAPDVVCVAGYPRRLPRSVCDLAPLGTFNVHAALLPRHRGRLPLFWIYYRNDSDTGVTVHHVSDRLDAGDVVAQVAFPLERGLPVEALNRRNAATGSALLLDTLAAADGRLAPRRQDESLATTAPAIRPGTPMLDPGWDVERVWHFLAGLVPWFREPLCDERGRRVDYRAVIGFERVSHPERPGVVRRAGAETRLFCEGGVVYLEADRRLGAPARWARWPRSRPGIA